MPVDKKSPRYGDYLAECKALFDEAAARERAYRDEYPDWTGQDHPNGAKIRAVTDERNRKFRALKEKYGFQD